MPQVLHNQHLTLNTDGERHPRENSLAVAAVIFGIAAFVLGFIVDAHMLAAIIGVLGFPLGLYSQMVSATTGERWLNVVGMIGSAVGLALALAHGGFTP
ncbi:MAG: hypothetical protein QOE54_1137 [Streptosporangiaceae bacterium]|jgi:hypothetical protein|nr:hypothetical protein [Streptosporangiaceae bacterium]MDX6428771.1 hypothetical protein [Streptosporangiaceae bacterium]